VDVVVVALDRELVVVLLLVEDVSENFDVPLEVLDSEVVDDLVFGLVLVLLVAVDVLLVDVKDWTCNSVVVDVIDDVDVINDDDVAVLVLEVAEAADVNVDVLLPLEVVEVDELVLVDEDTEKGVDSVVVEVVVDVVVAELDVVNLDPKTFTSQSDSVMPGIVMRTLEPVTASSQ